MSTKIAHISISARTILPVLTSVFFFLFVLFIQSCGKEVITPDGSEYETDRKNPPQPPPPPFYFNNCNNPTFSASFVQGNATNTPITKNYVNSPGGSYSAFTSATVNGITITAPAGTFNVGSGSVVFTAIGTPIATGF